jgi:hypothetical protein
MVVDNTMIPFGCSSLPSDQIQEVEPLPGPHSYIPLCSLQMPVNGR